MPTEMRSRVLHAVHDLTEATGYAPTVREVADQVGLSPGTAHYHIACLLDAGLLGHRPGKPRTLHVKGSHMAEDAINATTVREIAQALVDLYEEAARVAALQPAATDEQVDLATEALAIDAGATHEEDVAIWRENAEVAVGAMCHIFPRPASEVLASSTRAYEAAKRMLAS